jgi:hypothetical protein
MPLRSTPAAALAAFAMVLAPSGHAADNDLENRGHDPFFRISSGIADCPEPTGPRVTEAEYRREAHHRIEHGNHCWVEGRCRLPNAFQYDKEIAETLQRRLQWLTTTMPAWRNTSLWVTVAKRWVLVQGCVPKGFPTATFLGALREVPDVETVIDQTVVAPAGRVPYPVYGGNGGAQPPR